MKRDWTGAPVIAQMLVCSGLWATAFLAMKTLGIAFSPLTLAALRGLMGGVLLAGWVALVSGPAAVLPRGRERVDWLVLGLLQGLVPNALTAFALTRINAGLTAMIQATTPLMVAVLLPWLMPDGALTGRRLAGILTGFSGMALLLGPAAFGAPTDVPGSAAMLATALSYALGALYVKGIATADPTRLALGQQALSGVYALGLALAIGDGAELLAAFDRPWIMLAFGLFGTALPIVIFMNILRRAGPAVGSMNGYFLPPWTVFLGWLVFGEAISPREIAAMLIIFAGVTLVTRAGRRPATELPPTELR